VPARPYGQFCGLAKSLDLVGERWTLLIVRELLDRPKRYGDLLGALAPISTDILASRLRDLEAAGLVVKTTPSPPATGRAYELTEDGAALEPVVDAFVRWGRRLLEHRRPSEVVRPPWLARAVRALVRPDRTGDLVVRLVAPEGGVTLRITPGAVEDAEDTTTPDVVLTGDAEALARALDPTLVPDLLADGRLGVEGSPDDVRRLAALFAPGA